MRTEIGSERDYLESGLLEVVTRYGGERIIAGPPMEAMIRDLADFIESRNLRRQQELRAEERDRL